jgi:hypothetical protein
MELTRIERVAQELQQIRQQIKALETTKEQLGHRLTLLLRNEGAEDQEGKLRYTGSRIKLTLIQTVRESCNVAKLGMALLSQGMTPLQIATVKAQCVTQSKSEHVGIYEVPQDVEQAAREAS